ncbi:MAG: GGDEF domain-containing protein [Sneathiella sp.]
MSIIGYFFSAVTGSSAQSLSRERLSSLLTTKNHTPLLGRRRATVILSRIRLMALIGAFLYMGGIVLDFAAFEGEVFKSLLIYRTTAASLMLILILAVRKSDSLLSAYRALGIFFAINLIFQGLSQPLILPQYIASIDNLPTAGYAIFPFLIVVCIAVFPLTFKETFLTIVLFFMSEMITISLLPNQINPTPGLGVLLSLVVTGALCSFSAISQLSYMVSLVDQASIDALTNCFSRNSGEEILDVQFRIARRQKTPLSVAFLDLDNFKNINDRYGHEAGDRTLTSAASAIRRNLRDSDILIRWGGEEFLMLLPHTEAKGAANAIRRMRTNGLGIRPDGTPLTASIGIAELQTSSAESWADLVDLADEQMYVAKTNGKNDFSIHQGSNEAAIA